MEYKLMHRAYRPIIGGRAIPNHKLINDLGEHAIYYIGTFSEYNPIGLSPRKSLAVYIYKDSTCSINQQKPCKLPGFKLKGSGSYHGSDFNNNDGCAFSKQDLIYLISIMDDTDMLKIANVSSHDGSINIKKFQESIEKITRCIK